MQSGVTSTPINPVDRVSMEGTLGQPAAGQAPAVSYRLVKFDSGASQPGENPGRFMLSGDSAQTATNLFQTTALAKSKKVWPHVNHAFCKLRSVAETASSCLTMTTSSSSSPAGGSARKRLHTLNMSIQGL